MLRQRIFTAIILIPLFVVLVLALSARQFSVLTGAIVFWCAYEWSGLIGIKSFPKNIIYPCLMMVVLAMVLYFFYQHSVSVPQLLYGAFCWWCVAGVLVIAYPKCSDLWGKGMLLRGFMGFMVLIPCWVALNFIRMVPQGTYIVLLLFVLIWGADTGAYFVGKKWGKHKLLPLVSPGKTWQGLFGALFTSVMISVAAIFIFNIDKSGWGSLLLLTIVTVLFSILGDLFESMLKRKVGLKDSGRLLPGHGGILDRIDSLTAAAPVFALGMLLMTR